MAKRTNRYKTKCDKCSHRLKEGDGKLGKHLWAFIDAKTGKPGALCSKHMPKAALGGYTKTK